MNQRDIMTYRTRFGIPNKNAWLAVEMLKEWLWNFDKKKQKSFDFQ